MGAFRQLGDPVCPDCLCQHHAAAYHEIPGAGVAYDIGILYNQISPVTTIISQAITTTERCCIVVNAATAVFGAPNPLNIRIERPLGTNRTDQTDSTNSNLLRLMHHAAWEVLDAGTYTYYVVLRAGSTANILAAWMKIVASDCEG